MPKQGVVELLREIPGQCVPIGFGRMCAEIYFDHRCRKVSRRRAGLGTAALDPGKQVLADIPHKVTGLGKRAECIPDREIERDLADRMPGNV